MAAIQLSQLIRAARPYIGPAVVSGMVIWATLGVAVKQFVAEASWLYSMLSYPVW